MPDGIYLDALKLGPQELATKMSEIIADKHKYYDFFRWHNYYDFNLTSEDDYHREVCGLCKLLNNGVLMNQTTIMRNISKWWNETSPVLPQKSAPAMWHENKEIKLEFDEEEIHDTGVNGFMLKLFNRVFGS